LYQNSLKFFLSGSNRVVALDGLRAIAALAVVVHHFVNLVSGRIQTGTAAHKVYLLTNHLGGCGVDLFFVISGYLIYSILMRKEQKYLPFLLRRARRIYPLAIFCILVAIVAKLALGQLIVPTITGVTWLDILANFLLLPGMYPVDPIYAVTWTLSFEMFFYLTVPFLVMVFRKFDLSQKMRSFVCFGIIVLFQLTLDRHAAMSYFVIGVLVYEATLFFKVSQQNEKIANILIFLVCLPIFAYWQFLAAGLVPWPVEEYFVGKSHQRLIFWGSSLFILVLSVIHLSGPFQRFLSISPIQILGNASYSLYLLHALVIAMIVKTANFYLQVNFSNVAFFALLLVACVSSIFIALLSYVFLERPLSIDGKWPWQVT
jgi:exopolysaccharide production protein ExoZ